ncbi:MAG: caspase family protein, partial [Betaproteobacteria bacterium]|nr:caspase family protein [Betaproteobacteria bacterium]
MKVGLRLFALGWLVAALWLPGAAAAQSRALLIGISQYAEIDSLRYADADVKAFSEILTDFAGYRRSDVTVILN